MKISYISYYEGYDAIGTAIYNGNGAVSVECTTDEDIDPKSILEEHIKYLLALAQETNSRVVRIVIKSQSRL